MGADALAEMEKEETVTAGALTFHQVLYKIGSTGSPDLQAVIISSAGSGEYAYEFSVLGEWAESDAVVSSAAKWMAGFSQIHPSGDIPLDNPYPDKEVSAEGYSTTLGGSGWKPIPDAGVAAATVVALKGFTTLLLVPLPLPTGATPLESEIDTALLSCLGAETPKEAGKPVEVTHGELTGREYTFSRPGKFAASHYLVRILRADNMAWMLVLQGDLPEEVIAEGLRAVRLFSPPVSAKGSTLTSQVAYARGLILNELGVASLNRKNFDESTALFRAALKLCPGEPGIAGNLIDCFTRRQRTSEAIAELKILLAPGSSWAESERLRSRLTRLESAR